MGQPAVHTYRKALERSFFALSLLGILLTLHLAVWYGTGSIGANDPVCTAGSDCLAVIANDPAPLGMASAWWGFIFYMLAGTLTLGVALNVAGKSALFKALRMLLVGAGLIYSVILSAIQFVLLADWCFLCLLSASIVAVMTALVVIAWRTPAATAARHGLPRGELRFHGLVTAGVVVLLLLDYSYSRGQQASPDEAVAVTPDTSVDPAMCPYHPNLPPYENLDQIVTDYDPIVGPPDAPVTVMEFLDPNCNHCKSQHPHMKALIATYPEQVRIVYKPVTLVGGPSYSLDEVTALWIANEYGVFEGMLDLQFEHQSPATGLSPDRLASFAKDLGINEREFRAKLSSGEYEPRARQVRRIFDGMGLESVPSVIVGGRHVGISRSLGCLKHFVDQELEAL